MLKKSDGFIFFVGAIFSIMTFFLADKISAKLSSFEVSGRRRLPSEESVRLPGSAMSR